MDMRMRDGNYQWLVQSGSGDTLKIWSLRKGQSEDAFRQAQKEYKWKVVP